MKFTVELDWIPEDQTLDDTFKEEVLDTLTDRLCSRYSNAVDEQIEKMFEKCEDNMLAPINEKLNDYMRDFFERERTITDEFGDVIHSNVTLVDLMKKQCSTFLDAKVDEDGKVPTGHWSGKQTRLQYILKQTIDKELQYSIDRVIKDVKANLTKYVSETMTAKVGAEIAKAINLDKIVNEAVGGNNG